MRNDGVEREVREREQVLLKRRVRELEELFTLVLGRMKVVYWQRKDADKLVVWDQWARRYGVPVEVIMRTVVEYYRKVLGKKGHKELGVRLSSITGRKAGQMLEETLREGREMGVFQRQGKLRPERYRTVDEYRKDMLKRRRENQRREGTWRRRSMRSVKGDRVGWWERWMKGRRATDAVVREDLENRNA